MISGVLSGLSQEDFCREQEIPIAKFKYQWRKRMVSGSQKANSQNNSEKPIHFEQVRISNEDSIHQETLTSQSIIIQFPNQSSCEVKMDIKSRDFSSLLNQLRLLC
ncbi:IS66 family insertion sequence element accessory protein TnpA [Legionella waltersii]|uniref:IS66 family insertion sequence element accessory protein TnpA n=1 Tax=Legionella waltersii TaxID=66969 RepID=UPI00073046C7